MKLVGITFLALVVLVITRPVHGAQEELPRSFVLTRVTLIDATGAPARRDTTVIVVDGRISRLAETGEVSLPEGVEVIEGFGKVVIPGLWDMHVHIQSKEEVETFFPLFIANGVTGVMEKLGAMFVGDVRVRYLRNMGL